MKIIWGGGREINTKKMKMGIMDIFLMIVFNVNSANFNHFGKVRESSK